MQTHEVIGEQRAREVRAAGFAIGMCMLLNLLRVGLYGTGLLQHFIPPFGCASHLAQHA